MKNYEILYKIGTVVNNQHLYLIKNPSEMFLKCHNFVKNCEILCKIETVVSTQHRVCIVLISLSRC